ncbi:class I SAM-dependent methyltransferase [Paracoccus aestuariivivens]|uniref:Methyltransferase domain-containing protein n=1 Tax=Paracoccus aestuariivivens TaxID=1820333 RepID=A0A6L6J8T1_9RHOB|nr:class I SAM-dependent methyltransferase [Paracoccus aestuariivivens]MTH77575.1 methyltransferase domain-containing protein [Paracoccus aestuariivivens]
MVALDRVIASKLDRLSVPLRVRLPSGATLGPQSAAVELVFHDPTALSRLAAGNLGALAGEVVAGKVSIDGGMRDLMKVVAALAPDEGQGLRPPPWQRIWANLKSAHLHSRAKDAAQIRYHYDVSDEFYQLWLDPLRVYSCAYYRDPDMDLTQAQVAKLDHICRKLDLRKGERFVDIGAGWGGLLFHAAENYDVKATGITLSQNQFDHVSGMIRQKGLEKQITIELCDYRDFHPDRPFDKLASVGMFEHVGRTNMASYCQCIRDLLRPGGMALNHGITLTGLDDATVGGRLGEFIEHYIFPGGDLLHISQVIRHMSEAGLEMVDTENLRPHYARTLWAWSDRLEARLSEAEDILEQTLPPTQAGQVLRAFRLYLAGCALGFEESWTSLFQILLTRPDGAPTAKDLPGARSSYPFRRDYIYDDRSN